MVAGALSADEFVETFDNGVNTGGWSYGAPTETIESSGGNPGWFLHASGLDTFAPQPMTAPDAESSFTGDFRSRGVTQLSVDLRLFHVDFSAEDRPLTLILVDDRGTPFDFGDDMGVYVLGADVPLVNEGWKTISFDVPSQETSLPAGWRSLDFSGNGRDADWNTVITDVNRVHFFYGDPEFFFIFQMWECGLDNARIAWEPTGSTEITGFSIARGTPLEGGLADLLASDDQHVRYRSGFGTTFIDLHSSDLVARAETTVGSPATIDVSVESRVDQPASTMQIRLRNWNTGQFVTVGSFAVGNTDVVRSVNDVAAANFVGGGGEIDVSIKHLVFVPIFAFQFQSRVDHIVVNVE